MYGSAMSQEMSALDSADFNAERWYRRDCETRDPRKPYPAWDDLTEAKRQEWRERVAPRDGVRQTIRGNQNA